jgi:hypothetical protein
LATLAPTSAPPRARPLGRTRFYFWLSLACLAIGVGGFVPTYWLQVPAGGFTGTAMMHLHAIVFTAWLLLLVGQNWRIAQGRLDHHKAWGLVGISLATAMLVIGWTTAIVGLRERIAEGYGDDARAFLIVPAFSITAFFAFVIAAMANIRRPEWHKRLIFVATTIAILPALARVLLLARKGFAWGLRPGNFPPPPVNASLLPFVVSCAIIAAGMVHDWRSRGRPHPAWTIGLAVTVGGMILRDPISVTPAWQAFAGWTTRIAG